MGTVTTGFVNILGDRLSPSGVSTSAQQSFSSSVPAANSQANLNRPMSLIGIVNNGSDLVGSNLWLIALLLGQISFILAVFNLLPILPFDGGHAVVVIYEWIASKVKHRRVYADYRKFIPVSVVLIIPILFLGLSSMVLDIRQLGAVARSRRLRSPAVERAGGQPARSVSRVGSPWNGGHPADPRRERPGRRRRAGLGAVDDDHQDRRRRRHAGPDLLARRGGCDIVRCTCNEEAAAEGLAQIVPRSPVPLIADIHFQYKLALAAMEAGVQGLRLNPGNIRKPEHIKAVAREAKDRGLPDPHRRERRVARSRHRRAVRRRHPGGAGRLGAARARVLRRGRLRRREDLGEVVERAGDDRLLPAAVGDGRLSRCTSASPRPARSRAGW